MSRRKSSSHYTQRIARSVRAFQTYLMVWKKLGPVTGVQRNALAYFLEPMGDGRDDRGSRSGGGSNRGSFGRKGADAPPTPKSDGVLASLGV
jgi:hypothetical protein